MVDISISGVIRYNSSLPTPPVSQLDSKIMPCPPIPDRVWL